ncbi:MAG: molybdenum cofactor biosynthesis protein MoaE [Lewinellaceae bacterium]|nr:molybdenum cofactor biosynthesis protein MoaE [Saprospiraceae bacterium]MCB9337992.1 molybdenum cofactor biosynthesis protein MoaE [Lewinellaceae bacterium]
MLEIKLFERPLDAKHCIDFVSEGGVGAINVFIGSVRDHTQGKRVVRLEYEAYAPMAIAEMEKIARQAVAQFGALKIAVHHRVGTLEIGEAAVVIAVSTPHRQASFEACQYIIDTLKQTVPIWKKEIFEDGEIWVAAHP